MSEYLRDWFDPNDHEAHRRMAAERDGNYVGCAANCQSVFTLYPELLTTRNERDALVAKVEGALAALVEISFGHEWHDDSAECGVCLAHDTLSAQSDLMQETCQSNHCDENGIPYSTETLLGGQRIGYNFAYCPICGRKLRNNE